VSTTAKPAILALDVADLARMLERIRPQIAPEDHACVHGVVHTLITVTSLLRDSRTTIARLRGMLGWSSSEKTADVCGGLSASGDGSQAQGSQDGAPATGEKPDAGNGEDGGTERGGGDATSRRKGHGRIPAAAYPKGRHVAVGHEKLHPGDTCPQCACGKLHPLPEPARIVRIFGQAPLCATTWECERLRCGACGEVFTARAPAEAQGQKYADSAASMMALLRYGAGMPLNRLARLQANMQTPLPSSTQWEVVRDRVDGLRPVHDELVRRAAAGRVVHNDDTHARILELMGKRRAALLAAGELPDPERTGLFTTGVVADTASGPIVLFFTGRKHAGENLAALLSVRDSSLGPPMQMCDGLSRNLPKGHSVVLGNCLAHGRRHVVEEAENFPAESRHVLEALRDVFRNEARCHELALTPEQRLELHQRESAPVMGALRHWIEAQLEQKRVEPNSGLGQAFGYLLERWDPLTLFLRVPGAPIDNNICERGLKMAIRHRNNSLFYKSQRGASVGDLYMALIYTAELHRENAFEYLTALFEHERDVAAHPGDWLPWTYRDTLAARHAA
jgi:transposase